MNMVVIDSFGLKCYPSCGQEWLNKSTKTPQIYLYFEQKLIVNLFIQLVPPPRLRRFAFVSENTNTANLVVSSKRPEFK